MKTDNFILFPEVCGFSAAMNHPASESCSGINLDWKVYSCFIVFVLELKGEVTNVTCALQLQLHLTEYKSNKSLESLVGSRERNPRPSWWTNILQQSFGLKQIPRGKAQMQHLSNPRKLSGPLCRARVSRMKYEKQQKTPGLFWKTVGDCP